MTVQKKPGHLSAFFISQSEADTTIFAEEYNEKQVLA